MHAFLIISNNKEKIEENISKITKRLASNPEKFVVQKIADLIDFRSFTKVNLDRNVTLVIEDFNNTTVETQNAFLKSLEEPQEKLSFILTASNIDGVLPTIVSRC